MWIASSSWVINNRLVSIPNIKDIGTIIGFIDDLDTLDLLTNYTEALFAKMSQEKENVASPVQKPGYPDNPCPQCWNLSPANLTLVNDRGVKRLGFAVYSAVYSAAQALHKLLECDLASCKWGPETKIYPWKVIFIQRLNRIKHIEI